jgi:hypothetical protein
MHRVLKLPDFFEISKISYIIISPSQKDIIDLGIAKDSLGARGGYDGQRQWTRRDADWSAHASVRHFALVLAKLEGADVIS